MELFAFAGISNSEILLAAAAVRRRSTSPPRAEALRTADIPVNFGAYARDDGDDWENGVRRQVREYVRYTNRRSVVEDFTPLPEEQALYDDVSEYLRRNECAAIEPGKRTLLTMVYRKLLASSTYAIAPTLRRLAESLEKKLE
jgi:hypothetical protein